METSVIVEGFRQSEEYGLVYKNYIGDGDSSVFARIQEGYKHGRYVQKVECANHVTRALNDNLHKLAENTTYPLSSRQLLSKPAEGDTISRLERIVKGVRTAIKEAGVSSNQTVNSQLSSDIRNAPDHVFGNHTRCREFCKRKDRNEENVLSNIDKDFLLKIRQCLGNVEKKANSLASNQTTNIAERYMGLVAKFTGGKRVNFTSKGSFQNRCYGAALAHSKGPGWHLSPWKKFANRSPGAVFKHKVLSREKRHFKRKLKYSSEKKPLKKKRTDHGGYDKDYGPLATQADMEETEKEKKIKEFIDNLASDITNGPHELEQTIIGQHANPIWVEQRRNRLTASNFGTVAKRLPYTPCHNLVKTLLYPKSLNSEFITFGRENESKVIDLYTKQTKNEVTKCGLFVCVDHPFLGASSDGLFMDDGLVEVKCVPSIQNTTLREEAENRKKKDFCLELKNNQLQLKRTHKYYYQVRKINHKIKYLHVYNFTYFLKT